MFKKVQTFRDYCPFISGMMTDERRVVPKRLDFFKHSAPDYKILNSVQNLQKGATQFSTILKPGVTWELNENLLVRKHDYVVMVTQSVTVVVTVSTCIVSIVSINKKKSWPCLVPL